MAENTNAQENNQTSQSVQFGDKGVYLKNKIDALKGTIKGIRFRRRLAASFSLVLTILTILLFSKLFGGESHPVWASISLLSALISFLLIFSETTTDSENERKQYENELEYLMNNVSTDEQKAEQLFKAHSIELKKYYDLALRQNSSIFFVGVGCIIMGFAFAGVTLYLMVEEASQQSIENKIVIGAIGTISTFITNFVGSIFLRMHSGTLRSLNEFHNKLVLTHHLHFGNYLSSIIKDSNLKEKTLASLILKMSGVEVPSSFSSDKSEEESIPSSTENTKSKSLEL